MGAVGPGSRLPGRCEAAGRRLPGSGRRDRGPAGLASMVNGLEAVLGDGVRRLHYVSVPPLAARAVVQMLGAAGLAERASVVMEKPFGTDLASARELNAAVHERRMRPCIFSGASLFNA